MHKQTEICKRLDAIIRQVLPFLSGEHQQQVAVAVERAKQITMAELNAVMQQQAAGGPGGMLGAPPGLQAMEDRLKHSSSASPASSRDPREGPRDLNHRPRSPISARSPIRSSTPNDDMSAKRLKTEDL